MARNDNRPDPREIAHRLLRQVLAEARMLDDADLGAAPPEARARALALARTVLRHMGPLDQVITALTLRPPPLAAMNALRIAAAEMLIEGVPPHAAVSQAVALTRRAAPRLGGLVNAVGRKIAGSTLPDTPQELPKPIRGAVRGAFGDDITRAIETAHAARPPLDLTLRNASDTAAWAERLGADILPSGSLRLAAGAQISALPGYQDGAWWVQDAAAALPVTLLGDVAGKRVLDLCAAPGGKTLQLAARGADVTALDVSPGRLVRLRRNLKRTGLSARVIEADALAWVPEGPFDAIMIDAPCSATGTVRRHPDLPHIRPSLDLAPLLEVQAALLARAWDWVQPGGRVVFATCSLIPAEGERQVARAAAPWRNVTPDHAEFATDGGWRTRPDMWADRGGLDGFFMAALERPKATRG